MHWRARIGPVGGGAPLGAGVLVDSERVITCAHVVDGRAEVSVVLPGVAAEARARVAWAGEWREVGDHGDLAMLVLDHPLPVPPCVFAPLGSLRPRHGRTAYALRALGFPEGHDQDGTHVTVSTSQDRQLGGEWLELDVDKGHLRRLGEGFSGAGVYDPESEQVVGIVTDADLEGEYGGTQGRMLPLDAIRRHWEGLDDLLTLDWGLAARPRRELRAALEGSEGSELPGATVSLAVRRAFPSPRLRHPPFRSVWHAVRYVAEDLIGDDRLVLLLRELRDRSPADLAARIADWMGKWLPEELEGPERPAAPPVSVGSIMFRAEPMTRGGSLDLTVCAVVDGVPVARAGPVRIRRQQLRTKAEALLAAQVGAVHDFDWMVEFIVPQGLMGEPFEEWQLREPGAARPRPLRTVPVVVRHVDRLKPLTESRLTRRRWETVRARGRTRPAPVECSESYDYQAFYDWLEDEDDLCALAYAANPVDDWLAAALDTGVPIMLWRRRDCGDAGHAHCAPGAFLDRLIEAVAALDPDELPYEVMKLRKEARSPRRGHADHCGHRLTLFWDDPERKPDPPLAMGSKGND
ncbi:VMAP-C domain-containing protein [Streptomyces aureoverticillatus]|uniref:VMAP-C domain-containing protein n=1 Tax=Streptomyces aureoverticillatus TaxID=66871 RepID=UPI0013DC4FB4|nr:trypsin-like peptidase domain-containing protein [Streptomyces aureoverticillatus]QIB42614.1 trypsin-like peptidase domain-containing protein [Streptomyces aureoverticillatus]